MSDQTDASLLIGRVLAGKYRLDDLLGAGGMGAVYRGEHLGLGIPVAIKTMHAHVAARSDLVRRFRREAHAASLLAHRNVVRTLDFGEHEGLLFLVMELLEGRSVSDWRKGYGTTYAPVDEVVDVIAQTFDALEAIHGAGIVHRDLKPDNLFMVAGPGRPVIKLVDFGLARVDDARDTGPALTTTGIIAGTPEYMSPEQCQSLAVGPSSDLYAVGCILTELLQRKPPFSGQSPAVLMTQHMFLPPPAIARDASAEPVPAKLEKLRLDLLAKLPARRPADAHAARARLAEVAAPENLSPARASGTSLGPREERAPDWDPATPVVSTRTKSVRPAGAAVAVLAMAGAAGLDDDCRTGLAASGLSVSTHTDTPTVIEHRADVVLIDGGASLDAAILAAKTIRAATHAPVVIALDRVDAERLRAVVASGAADAIAYPLFAEVVAKKLMRVVKRGR